MKITKRQLKRIIKEEKVSLLREVGDPIADELLSNFILRLANELYALYVPEDVDRFGSPEEYEEQVDKLADEVEGFVRTRLGDLYAGDIRLEIRR